MSNQQTLRSVSRPIANADAREPHINGCPVYVYQLQLTPQQVREIRSIPDCTDEFASHTALRLGVKSWLVKRIRDRNAYQWVGDHVDGSADVFPRNAFRLSDSAVQYIRSQPDTTRPSTIARRLEVAPATVTRIRAGERQSGNQCATTKPISWHLDDADVNLIEETLLLGAPLEYVQRSLREYMEESMWGGISPTLLSALTRNTPLGSTPAVLRMVQRYRHYRKTERHRIEMAKGELRRGAMGFDIPARRSLPVEAEAMAIRAFGQGVSARAVALAFDFPMNRIHVAVRFVKQGITVRAMRRLAMASIVRAEARASWTDHVLQQFIDAMDAGASRLADPPPPWPLYCAGMFDNARPEDFDFAGPFRTLS